MARVVYTGCALRSDEMSEICAVRAKVAKPSVKHVAAQTEERSNVGRERRRPRRLFQFHQSLVEIPI